MGYTTDFRGSVKTDKPVDEETYNLLVGLNAEHNYPPRTQPGLWMQWKIQEDHQTIEWDGGENFYE